MWRFKAVQERNVTAWLVSAHRVVVLLDEPILFSRSFLFVVWRPYGYNLEHKDLSERGWSSSRSWGSSQQNSKWHTMCNSRALPEHVCSQAMYLCCWARGGWLAHPQPDDEVCIWVRQDRDGCGHPVAVESWKIWLGWIYLPHDVFCLWKGSWGCPFWNKGWCSGYAFTLQTRKNYKI